MRTRRLTTTLLAALLVTGCTTVTEQQRQAASSSAQPPATTPTTSAAPPTTPTTALTTPPSTPTTTAPPPWVVGASPLPRRPDGFGQILPTPPQLVNRSLPTKDTLPPPASATYASTVSPIPDDVLARSTWQPGCPVRRDELRYLTMSFWGFDGLPHSGEMIVNATWATRVTQVFGTLYANHFPLEEMRVTAASELDLPPTGDGNNTSAFVCRPAVGMKTWSAHAYGLAIDVNPFCNPYIKGSLVLPELASAYVDRRNVRPGMVLAGDPVVGAFRSIGWTWGGSWTSPVDIQHFSATGR